MSEIKNSRDGSAASPLVVDSTNQQPGNQSGEQLFLGDKTSPGGKVVRKNARKMVPGRLAIVFPGTTFAPDSGSKAMSLKPVGPQGIQQNTPSKELTSTPSQNPVAQCSLQQELGQATDASSAIRQALMEFSVSPSDSGDSSEVISPKPQLDEKGVQSKFASAYLHLDPFDSLSPRSSKIESLTNDKYEDDFEFSSDDKDDTVEESINEKAAPLTYCPAMQTSSSQPIDNVASREYGPQKETFTQDKDVQSPILPIASTPSSALISTSLSSSLSTVVPSSSTSSNAATRFSTSASATVSNTASNFALLCSSTTSTANDPDTTSTVTVPSTSYVAILSKTPFAGKEKNNSSSLDDPHTIPFTSTNSKKESENMGDDFLPDLPNNSSPPPSFDYPPGKSSEIFTNLKSLPKIAEENEVDFETSGEDAELDKMVFELSKVERERFGLYVALVELKEDKLTPEQINLLYQVIHDLERFRVLVAARNEYERTGDAVKASQPFWKFCSENACKADETSYTKPYETTKIENPVENSPPIDAATLEGIAFQCKEHSTKKCSRLQTSEASAFYQTNTLRENTPVANDRNENDRSLSNGEYLNKEENPKSNEETKLIKESKVQDQIKSAETVLKKPLADEPLPPFPIQASYKRLTDEPLPPLQIQNSVVASSSKNEMRKFPIPQKKLISLNELKCVETEKCMSGKKVKKGLSQKRVSLKVVNKKQNKIAPFNSPSPVKEDLATLEIEEAIPEPQQKIYGEPEEISKQKPWWRKCLSFGKRKLFGCCLPSNENEIIFVEESKATEQ